MPTLYGLKPWYTRKLSVFIKFAGKHNLSPDFFTSVGGAGAIFGLIVLAHMPGGVGVSTGLMFLAIIVRLGGANLDGAVARARGVSSPVGFIKNEIGDRMSDFLLFVGLFLAVPFDAQYWVLLVAIVASFPTLMSVSGAAVGVPRINGGPFGKTERCLCFILSPLIIAWGLLPTFVLLGIMGVGSLLTSITRYRRIEAALESTPTAWTDTQPTVVTLDD